MALLQEKPQPCGQDRANEPGRHASGDRRHNRAAEERDVPDRRQAHPRARERLVRLAKKKGLNLRQSYVRVGQLALISHQRYAHAKQFKRANKVLRRLKTYLGRTTRDVSRRCGAGRALQMAALAGHHRSRATSAPARPASRQVKTSARSPMFRR